MWRSSFRTEAAAFDFLLLTLVAFAAVAIAALAGGAAAGLPVWAVVSGAAVVFSVRRRRPAQVLRTAPAHMGPAGERRLLVLAQETPSADALDELGRRADRVIVVSTAGTSLVRRWLSDVDGARARASRRVDETVRCLRAANVDAAAVDEDPVRAIEDALRVFGGDEIVVATGPSARDAAVAARVRARFALPVTHLVA